MHRIALWIKLGDNLKGESISVSARTAAKPTSERVERKQIKNERKGKAIGEIHISARFAEVLLVVSTQIRVPLAGGTSLSGECGRGMGSFLVRRAVDGKGYSSGSSSSP